MLLGTRSNSLVMVDFPEAGVIGDMVQALDAAVQADATAELQEFLGPEEFCMETYRLHIRERLRGCMASFSSFPPIADDARLDKIRRFVTLIFMEHMGEVCLENRDNEIVVIPHGTDD